jgi:hypothetical protein
LWIYSTIEDLLQKPIRILKAPLKRGWAILPLGEAFQWMEGCPSGAEDVLGKDLGKS